MARLRNILSKPLFRATSLNAFSVALKLAIGLVTSKLIAVFVGPSGMALVGNLRNVLSALETAGTLGFQNGVVKYTAEHKEDDFRLQQVLVTVFLSLAVVAVVISALLFFGAGVWSQLVFGGQQDYANIFLVLAAAMPWYACSVFLIAAINGLGKFREVVYINIIGNLMGLVLSLGLIWQYRTFGALLSLVLAPALVFFAAVAFLPQQLALRGYFDRRFFSLAVLRNLSSYSLMAVVSAVISPLVLVAVRNRVIQQLGMEAAGYWEAMTRISGYYLLFVTTIVSVYFLPKLAAAKTHSQTRAAVFSYWKHLLPLFAVALFVLYVLRDFVISLLFTKAFAPVSDLFFWQLLGDLLKAFTLILGYNLVAKKHTAAFVITEFISMGILFFGSQWLVPRYGIEGVVMVHFVTYAVYAAVLVVYFRRVLGSSTAS